METLNLRGIPCPQNTAKALLFLEMQDEGQTTLILIDDGEPYSNFMESMELEISYEIKKAEKDASGNFWEVEVLKIEE